MCLMGGKIRLDLCRFFWLQYLKWPLERIAIIAVRYPVLVMYHGRNIEASQPNPKSVCHAVCLLLTAVSAALLMEVKATQFQ